MKNNTAGPRVDIPSFGLITVNSDDWNTVAVVVAVRGQAFAVSAGLDLGTGVAFGERRSRHESEQGKKGSEEQHIGVLGGVDGVLCLTLKAAFYTLFR